MNEILSKMKNKVKRQDREVSDGKRKQLSKEKTEENQSK
jgi:hypothetical protein